MKILITGANGYIGKSLYNSLKEEYEITTLTRYDFDLTNKQATNLYFQDKYFDVILHCAVKGGSRLVKDNQNVLDDNINMYCNLLENKSHFNKFINFGSGAELYMTDNFYGLSKFIIRNSILKQDNFYNIRIFGVFDENELDTRFIKSNIKKYINKESIIIHQDKIMDFFYMKDLISLVKYYIMNNNLSKEINCSYYKATTLFNIAEIINNLSDYKVPIILGDNNLGKNYREKYNLIIDTIGLEQGIINTYNILK